MKITSKEELARALDYSVLPKQTTRKEIIDACAITREYRFAAFYTSSPYWSFLVAEELADYPEIEIGTGIAFPFGSAPLSVKRVEMEKALEAGCTAIDMVINCGALRSGEISVVDEEIRLLAEICRGRAVSKCILDVCFLTEEEIRRASESIIKYQIDFAKTSTGQFEGPNLSQILLMKQIFQGTEVKLKVAGVKFPRPQNALIFLNAGADRIGTRAAVEIINSWDDLVSIGLAGKSD